MRRFKITLGTVKLHESKDVELLELGREMRRFIIALETPGQDKVWFPFNCLCLVETIKTS